MTDIKQGHQNRERDDEAIGPKIRHPSGPVYLNIIFLQEEYDKTKLSSVAKLYQSIIQYSLSSEYNNIVQKQQRREFKITDIGYWLLDHNEDFINYYTDSKFQKGVG
jgi:hypothetical protein